MNQDMQRLRDIVDHFDDAMLINREPDGNRLSGRPMRIACDDHFPTISFVTSADSDKVAGIAQDPRMMVTLQGGGRYASINGTATVNRDRSRLEELWNTAWDLWFEDGPNTADVVLLDVEIVTGEFWDMSGKNRLLFAIEAGKALLQDRTIDPASAGEHGYVSRAARG